MDQDFGRRSQAYQRKNTMGSPSEGKIFYAHQMKLVVDYCKEWDIEYHTIGLDWPRQTIHERKGLDVLLRKKEILNWFLGKTST